MTRPDRRSNAGIDDLFGYDDEPAAVEDEAREGSRVRWLIRNGLLVVAATAATVVALRAADVRVSVPLVFAGYLALRVVQRVLADIAPPPPPRAPKRTGDDGGYRWAGTDALRGAVRRWENRLDWAQNDPDRFSSNVLPVLAELTDERLRQRHGITRRSDPRRARELLGEPLWRMLAEPDSRPPKARDLVAHVETLEKL